MRAMILAAGKGTRLRPITLSLPKPLVPVVNRPVMEHIIELLAAAGYTEVLANLSHLPEQIRERFGEKAGGVSLTYREEERLLGTAGGVRNAADFLGESFLVISGDALTDVDLTALREFHESHDGLATLTLKRVPDTSEYGVVIVGSDGRIQGFQEKPDPAEALSDLANCGIYMFRSEIFDYFPEPGTSKAADPDDDPGFADWAMDVFPALLDADIPFYGHEIDAYWNDIGNLEELRQGNVDALEEKVRVRGEGELREPGVLVGKKADIAADARLAAPLVVGDGCSIGKGASVSASVLLPGARVEAGAEVENAVVAEDAGVV